MTILDRIVETKRKEIERAKTVRPSADIQAAAQQAMPPRDFFAAVADPAQGVHLIAEIKKQSPSAGQIVHDFDPVAIARTYHAHGAATLSVLTDEVYFGGRIEFIQQVKEAVPLPVLRKDFVLDAYQIYEARAYGADAVLLIAEVLSVDEMADLLPVAKSLEMAVLVEVHGEENLVSVLKRLGIPNENGYLLGINNRDLTAQRTDLATMSRLATKLPPGTRFVAESGIATHDDLLAAQHAGACAVLVGESLLRAQDIGDAVDELLKRD